MEPPRTLAEVRDFLERGGNIETKIPASSGSGVWTFLQRAAFSGPADMVALLLGRGASLDIFTDDGRSALDLACDSENWEAFGALCRVADERHPLIQYPFPKKGTPDWEEESQARSFYPSSFFMKLQNPFESLAKEFELKEFDMRDGRKVREAINLWAEMIPYPDRNRRLLAPYHQICFVAFELQKKGEMVQRGLAFANFWLNRCLKYHACADPRPFSDQIWPVLPKRVVDVSRVHEGHINLASGGSKRSPYCALSYRWIVKDALGVKPAVVTTTETLEAFGIKIPLDGLQYQLRDAFLIANGMGIRYVWVDALCIIQKSDAGMGDFDEEAPKMASIYGNSTLTIAFTNDVRFGATAMRNDHEKSKPLGDLDTRGWTLQEQLLSNRLLFVTKNGLFWDCLDKSASETCPYGIPKPSDDFRALDQRTLKRFMFNGNQGDDKNKPDELAKCGDKETILCLWRKCVVEEYTRRHLSYGIDKAVAAVGITSMLTLPLSDQCFAGIWRQDALRSLLWHTSAPTSRPLALSFPTWSWYSVDGPVLFRLQTPFSPASQRAKRWNYMKDDMRYRHPSAEVLHITCEQDTKNPNVHRGQVALRGVTVRAFLAVEHATNGERGASASATLIFPRRRGVMQELMHRWNLATNSWKVARHDGGPQPEFKHVCEFPFIDIKASSIDKVCREVLCVVLGHSDEGFPLALVLEKVEGKEEYQRLGTVAIDQRLISLELHGSQPCAYTDDMGEIRTVIIV